MPEIKLLETLLAKNEILKKEISNTIIGQEQVIRNILLSIYAGGHALLIGVPGLAKTLIIKTIANALNLDFNRIQFTPDLMPSDIIGSEILNRERTFQFIKGPIFSNIILADEINRTPPKTQAALLEAMQERQITVAGQKHQLENPYFVLATQNPIEQEGTYPLPEAQLDRFMFSIELTYPSFEEELEIAKSTQFKFDKAISPVFSKQEIVDIQNVIQEIPVSDNVYRYTVDLVHKTRPNTTKSPEIINKYIDWGAGPRASQYLILAAKTHAVLTDNFSPDIKDIQTVAYNILNHRIIKNFKAESENISKKDIIDSIL